MKICKHTTIAMLLAAYEFGSSYDPEFGVSIDGDNMQIIVPTVKGL